MRLSICHMYGRYINSLATILFPILDNCDIFDVYIGGTSWQPEIPDFDTAKSRYRENCEYGTWGENARLRCSVIFVAPNF